MPRIVMKFGGTSMAGIERIRSVAARVQRKAEAGNQVLVVVSAMAGETDRLVHLCREAAPLYDPREYDVVVASGEQVTAGLLAITLSGMGANARSYMGWQLPIRASGHSSALIDHIDGDRWAVVRPRLDVDALIAADRVPDWLGGCAGSSRD